MSYAKANRFPPYGKQNGRQIFHRPLAFWYGARISDLNRDSVTASSQAQEVRRLQAGWESFERLKRRLMHRDTGRFDGRVRDAGNIRARGMYGNRREKGARA